MGLLPLFALILIIAVFARADSACELHTSEISRWTLSQRLQALDVLGSLSEQLGRLDEATSARQSCTCEHLQARIESLESDSQRALKHASEALPSNALPVLLPEATGSDDLRSCATSLRKKLLHTAFQSIQEEEEATPPTSSRFNLLNNTVFALASLVMVWAIARLVRRYVIRPIASDQDLYVAEAIMYVLSAALVYWAFGAEGPSRDSLGFIGLLLLAACSVGTLLLHMDARSQPPFCPLFLGYTALLTAGSAVLASAFWNPLMGWFAGAAGCCFLTQAVAAMSTRFYSLPLSSDAAGLLAYRSAGAATAVALVIAVALRSPSVSAVAGLLQLGFGFATTRRLRPVPSVSPSLPPQSKTGVNGSSSDATPAAEIAAAEAAQSRQRLGLTFLAIDVACMALWFQSSALGTFAVALEMSRYMHGRATSIAAAASTTEQQQQQHKANGAINGSVKRDDSRSANKPRWQDAVPFFDKATTLWIADLLVGAALLPCVAFAITRALQPLAPALLGLAHVFEGGIATIAAPALQAMVILRCFYASNQHFWPAMAQALAALTAVFAAAKLLALPELSYEFAGFMFAWLAAASAQAAWQLLGSVWWTVFLFSTSVAGWSYVLQRFAVFLMLA